MMERSLTVHEQIPLPARRLVHLTQQLLRTGRASATRLIQSGGVFVNGKVTRRADLVLQVGDRLDIRVEAPRSPTSRRAGPARVPLEVVYHDADIIVVNKPAALLTVPTPHKESHTLIALVERWLKANADHEHAYCVHRLDRGVSGLLVFGKRLEIAQALRNQFADRRPQRQYVAIVAGTLADSQGTFQSHLTTERKTLRRFSTTDTDVGELAITHYQVRRTVGDTSVVEVRLETGRRHQIRVHFAEAGHPILGDPRYSTGPAHAWPHKRLALHALSLAFTHPTSNRPLAFSSRLPVEFQPFSG